MADTINLPGFGPTKKGVVYVAGAGLFLVAGIAWYRSKHQAPAAAVAAPATDTTADDTTDTGDSSLADLYGAYGTDTGSGASGDIIGYDPYGNPIYGSSGSASTGYTTNAAWSQAAEGYLVDTEGLDANAVGAALGKYITGQPINPDQIAIIEQAIAFTGNPPVNGPNGSPPSFVAASTGTGTGTGTTSTGKPGVPTGLTITGVGPGSVNGKWNAVTGATSYGLWSNGKKIGTASSTSARWTIKGGVKKGTTVGVSAINASGESGRAYETV